MAETILDNAYKLLFEYIFRNFVKKRKKFLIIILNVTIMITTGGEQIRRKWVKGILIIFIVFTF
ncbi:hypothetical protein EEL30_22520 [Brevibacillus laterosporus]|uniref:Uncharacterized protein n=1 Tax=Brevibacillus laterosporus TaxID=1465 RepID=A0A518VCT5_BRELA|nr:hypothetical protein EEL30_22520 [Brevibacillus laterosporus]